MAGAGLSVSCGIPDFRSKDGLYAKVAAEFPHLRDPQSIFDKDFFREDPRPFFTFAKNIFVPMSGGELHYKPSAAHRFITQLEKENKLLRIYTQNIDGLEVAGGLSHERVVACHGSFETSTCTHCRRKVASLELAEHINNGTVAFCSSTSPTDNARRCPGVLKPDIVFFGESLPSHFHRQMALDRSQADLIIVVGTSLRVRPVSLIPFAVSEKVPQILINRERLRHMVFDAELLGECDIVTAHLKSKLGWNESPVSLPPYGYYPPNTYVFATKHGNPAAEIVPPRISDDTETEPSSGDSDEDSDDNGEPMRSPPRAEFRVTSPPGPRQEIHIPPKPIPNDKRPISSYVMVKVKPNSATPPPSTSSETCNTDETI